MPETLRVFVDSSVLMAAAISARGAARELITQGLRRRCELSVSPEVLLETERNLVLKAPEALGSFYGLRDALPPRRVSPALSLVIEAGEIVVWKDAVIVAGAAAAQAHYLATYDRKHLIAHAEPIKARFGIVTTTPDEILRSLG